MEGIVIGLGLVLFLLQLIFFFSVMGRINKSYRHLLGQKWELKPRDGSFYIVASTGIKFPLREQLLTSINAYFTNNQGSLIDFNFMKDIVERSVHAYEQHLQSLVWYPLYFSAVGALLIFWSHDLGVLLLLLLVVLGGLFTIISISHLRKNKIELENDKSAFYNWIHTYLLPKVANDLGLVLSQFAQHMTKFNGELTANTANLEKSMTRFAKVFDEQRELVGQICTLRSDELVAGNAKMLVEWQKILPEMQRFSTFFMSINHYLSELNNLAKRLDEHENRTQAIEKMGNYFLQALNQIERHNQALDGARYDMRTSVEAGIAEWNKSLVTFQEQYLQEVQRMQEVYTERLAAVQKLLTSDVEQKAAESATHFTNELQENFNALLEATRLQTHYLALLLEGKEENDGSFV